MVRATAARRARASLLGLVLLTLGATVSGGMAAEPRELVVFAASDLALAFRELMPRAEAALGVKVTVALGSTGNLARQIEHGAPADVFFAADRQFVDRLAASGAVIPETRTVYAQGRLVLATARRSGAKATALGDLVAARFRHVALANPAHAPYGRAAEQALRQAGVWEAVKPKLVYAENIQQALQYVQSGAADAGLIALSLASAPDIEWVSVDPALHAPLDQALAVVSKSARPDLARALVEFVNGREGRAIMKRFGFILPGEF
jgi:molybdate transport system substrate-binding protein